MVPAEVQVRPRRTERRVRRAAAVARPTAGKPEPATEVPPVGAKEQSADSSSRRRFEFVGDGSSKFWQVTVDDRTLSVHFGRIGTAGQTRTKDLATPAAAQREADKLVAEKLRKGYREIDGRAASDDVED